MTIAENSTSTSSAKQRKKKKNLKFIFPNMSSEIEINILFPNHADTITVDNCFHH